MVNAYRGDVALEADGATWTLRYTVNAIARTERAFGDLPWHKVLARVFDADKATTDDMIRLFRAGLWHHHRDLTEEQAGDIMEDAGLTEVAKAVLEALGVAMPAPREVAPADPPKAGG